MEGSLFNRVRKNLDESTMSTTTVKETRLMEGELYFFIFQDDKKLGHIFHALVPSPVSLSLSRFHVLNPRTISPSTHQQSRTASPLSLFDLFTSSPSSAVTLFLQPAMSWPNHTVPKFGDWDKNSDLSYSVLFDEARADRERYLSLAQEDANDRELFRKMTKGHHGIHNQLFSEAQYDSDLNVPNRRAHGIGNGPPEADAALGRNHLVDRDAAVGSLKQPVLMPTSLEAARFYAHQQNVYHEQRLPEQHQVKFHTGPPAEARMEGNSTARKHGRNLNSGFAKAAEKCSVPKFGNWNVANSKTPPADDFTKLFDIARVEKKSASGQRSALTNISMLRPEKDLFVKSRDSNVYRKKRDWLNPLCCLSHQ